MNVSFPIPKELESYLEVQIQSGNYASVADYFLMLLQQDQRRKDAQAKLASLLQEGLDSEAEPVTPEYWRDLRGSIFGAAQ
jgi:antitoxin ParD1/3/4